jgi:hypothetical protein
LSGSNLSVKITADTTDVQVKFALARAETSALSAELRKLASASAGGIIDSAAQTKLQQVAGDLLHARSNAAALAEQLNATRGATGGFGTSLEQMSAGMSKLAAVTGIGIAAEGVRMLGEAISTLGERAIQIQTMSAVLAVTTSQFQAMSVAGEEAGVSAEVFARAGEKLTTMLTEARAGSGKQIESLHELGITTGDIANKNFQLNDVLAVLRTRLEDTNTAEQTRKALLQDLGSRTALAIEAIKIYDGSQQGVANAMQRVNGLMPEQVEELKEIKTFWGEVGTGIANASAKLLIYATESVKAYGAAEAAMAGAAEASTAPSGPGRSTSATGEQQEQQAAAESARAQEALRNEVLQNEMEKIREGVAAFAQGSAERLAALRQYAADAKQYYGADNVAEVRKANQDVLAAQREFNETQSRDAIAAAKEQASAINADTSLSLSQRLDAERQLWSGVLASDKVAGAQRVEAAREFSREYTEIAKQTAAQTAAIERSDISTDIAISKIQLDAKRSTLEQEVSANQISAAQKLAAMRQLAAESFSLDLQMLESEISTLQAGTAEYERVYNQIRELKAKLTADLMGYDSQYARDLAKQLKQQDSLWKSSIMEIESAEGSFVSNVLGRRKSMGQSLEQLGAQLVEKEIANDLKAMTTRILLQKEGDVQEQALKQGGYLYHAGIELQKLLATTKSVQGQTGAITAGQTAQNSSLISSAAAGKAVQAASGPSQVMADAAEAFAGAYAATAAIPYIGPELAPAAAAEAYAAVASMAGAASLDVGTNYVPQDMPAFLHEGERVTPKAYNPDAGYEGEQSGPTEVHHHYNGNTYASALDARGVGAMLKAPGMRREVGAAARRFLNRGGGR